MKHFVINETLSMELVTRFIDFMNTNNNEVVSIFITSRGGAVGAMDIMSQVISRHEHYVYIYAVDLIASSAFDLVFKSYLLNPMVILNFAPDTFGIIHFSRKDIGVLVNEKPYYDEDKFYVKNIMPSSYQRQKEFYLTLGISSSNIEKMENTDDVYLTTGQLREIHSLLLEERRKMF